MNLAVSKIGPALMAGNSVVIKPPTQGAVSAIQMVQVRPRTCQLSEEWFRLKTAAQSRHDAAVCCCSWAACKTKHVISADRPRTLQAFHKAGVPKGIINIVTGRGSEIGDYLTVRTSWHQHCTA